jgi:hypothetical protein
MSSPPPNTGAPFPAPGPMPTSAKPKISAAEQIRLNRLKAEQDRLRFTIADINGDDLGKAPFANQGMFVPEYSIPWWFEYFWAEAKMSASADGKQQLADIANTVFVKTPNERFKYKAKPEFERFTDRGQFTRAWRDILTTLLYLGFRSMSRSETGAADANLPPVNGAAPQHIGLQREFFRYIEARKQNQPRSDQQVEIYYRSETRKLEEIVGHQGTRRQIDVDSLARSMNMSAPWHPFSVPEIKDKMWFRRGNADNDYFTVISVAQTMEVALSFPKIDERRVYQFPSEPIERWTPQQLDYHRKNLATVRLRDGSKKVVVVTETGAYMCVVTGAVLDTVRAGGASAGGQSFPEQGIADIPLDHIFAVFPVFRYHHGHNDAGEGFTAFIDWTRARPLKDMREGMDLYGAAFDQLWDVYMHWKYHGPIVSAWSKTGTQRPSISLDIAHVISNPIDPATLDDLKRGVGAANPAIGHQAGVLDSIRRGGAGLVGGLKPPPVKH